MFFFFLLAIELQSLKKENGCQSKISAFGRFGVNEEIYADFELLVGGFSRSDCNRYGIVTEEMSLTSFLMEHYK